jgi:NAD(P)-dependent dehydrogenase (short-subunit alcohol dehydrogenase family)
LGVSLAVHGRDARRGSQLVQELQAQGNSAIFVRADLTGASEVSRLGEQARAALGGIDVLVNNAAIYPQHGWCNCRKLCPFQTPARSWPPPAPAPSCCTTAVCSGDLAIRRNRRDLDRLINLVAASLTIDLVLAWAAHHRRLFEPATTDTDVRALTVRGVVTPEENMKSGGSCLDKNR